MVKVRSMLKTEARPFKSLTQSLFEDSTYQTQTRNDHHVSIVRNLA